MKDVDVPVTGGASGKEGQSSLLESDYAVVLGLVALLLFGLLAFTVVRMLRSKSRQSAVVGQNRAYPLERSEPGSEIKRAA